MKTSSQKRDVFEDAQESLEFLSGDLPEYAPAIEHIRTDLRWRRHKGIQTYGESLQVDNGRDALLDLYEELLDAYAYSRQVCLERYDTGDEDEVEDISAALLEQVLIPLAQFLGRKKSKSGFLSERANINTGVFASGEGVLREVTFSNLGDGQ